MLTFLPSSVESGGGGHGLCHQLLEKRVCPLCPKKERSIAMVTFLDAIGKIITADAPPSSVPDPSDPPASVKMTRARAEEVVREVVRKHFEERLRSLN